MGEYAAKIVGTYTTVQSRDLSHRSGFSLALEAVRGAAVDAGIDISEIDGISASVSGRTFGGPGAGSAAWYWSKQFGRPMHWIPSGGGITAIVDAAMAIDHGLASTVAVVTGMSRPPAQGAVAPWTRPDEEFTAWTGSYTAVQYALVAQRYLYEYGDGAIEAMGQVSATIRNYGNVNPAAVYFGRGPYTVEDILQSRPIASPLTLLMCSSVNDGGCAVIVTSAERAADTPKKPISILAAGNQQPYAPYFEVPVLDAVADEGAFVRRAMARAGVTHDDIDVVTFYDHFAIGVLMEYEMFGFCGRGEAADFVRSGVMSIDGRFPTCTDGGNQSFSHNGSPVLFRPIEAVRQLRGEVEDLCPAGAHTHADGCRAVRDPHVAFTSNPGPPTGGNAFMIVTDA